MLERAFDFMLFEYVQLAFPSRVPRSPATLEHVFARNRGNRRPAKLGRARACHAKRYVYNRHVKVANIADVKNDLSRYVAEVRRGGRVRILVRGVPAADLVAVVGSGDAELKQLEALGLVRPGTALGAANERDLGRPGPRVRGGGAVEALVEERRSRR